MTNGMGRAPQAAVIGDAAANPETIAVARKIGELLGKIGAVVVTGGGGGVMDEAAKGAVQVGGTTVAILPSYEIEDAGPDAQIVIPTGLGFARNVVLALSCDIMIALGGGADTLNELTYAWMHGRTIFTLKGFGGWCDRLSGQPLDHRTTSKLVECADLKELAGAVVETCRAKGLTLVIDSRTGR